MFETLLYWHWIVFGVVLALLEIFVPSFTALWFGLGAILLGIVLFIFPELSLVMQILMWTVFSVLMTWLWFKYLKPLSVDRTAAGLSREAVIGEVGQIILKPEEGRRGRVRFSVPVLGDDEWEVISKEDLALGDRVRVVDVSGNSLLVEKS